jgi:hypothetical protein
MAAKNDKLQGTCSVCLRLIQLHNDHPIRHGFSAVGVRHGQSGGYHTGPCQGTRFPHLGISTAGTQWALGFAHDQLSRTTDRLRELAGNPDFIWYPRERGSYNKVRGGLPDMSRPVTLQYGKDDTYVGDGRPTYANEHRRKVVEQTNIKDELESAIAAYERVLASWSPDKYPTIGAPTKIDTVHMERPILIRGVTEVGVLCKGLRAMRGQRLRKTSDPAKVTCKRCRAALGLPPL